MKQQALGINGFEIYQKTRCKADFLSPWVHWCPRLDSLQGWNHTTPRQVMGANRSDWNECSDALHRQLAQPLRRVL